MTKFLGNLINFEESTIRPTSGFQDSTASGVFNLHEQLMLNKQSIWPTAGVDDPAKFVENLFSCFTYTGNDSSSRAIDNGIDLSGEGGMVWFKSRTVAQNHRLFDTARGHRYSLIPNATSANNDHESYGLVSFNNNGFTLGASVANGSGGSGGDYVSWAFRKASKFFDVVTYTGDGSAGKTISHSLGQAPGMILVKNTAQFDNWAVYHRGADSTAPEDKYLILNTNAAVADSADWWNDTAPTSSVFTVGTDHSVNANGENYVAYLFGHDTSSDGMIQCGSYDGNGSNSGAEINLGFEPQWVMIKRINNVGNWYMFDTIRGLTSKTSDSSFGTDAVLFADDTNTEVDYSGSYLKPTANGFANESTSLNSSGQKYIYMAIRKAPMQTPTSRSSVFAINNRSSTGSSINITSNFPVDWFFTKERNEAYGFQQLSRLQGSGVRLGFYGNFADQTDPSFEFDHNNKVVAGSDSSIGINRTGESNIDYMFRRAPKFFDVVTYVGTGSAKTENHNLDVAPEMMWIKDRTTAEDWAVYYGDATDYLKLNTDAATADDNTYWNDTAPTSTVFTVGTQVAVNINTGNFVAYLFATLAGISKVGTFSHTNGSSTDVDCGFSSGASFVIAKRTDSTGDWYLWDSTRGIISGNDPYVLLNTTAAQVSNTDYIDPLSSGFQIASGFTTGSYMFYAIAS